MQNTIPYKNLVKQKKIVRLNLLIDSLTFLPVITIALLSNSLVLASDVFDYIFTLSAEFISLVVLNRCLKNERGKYDFGLGKLESLSALLTSSFMLIMLLLFAYHAVERMFDTIELDSTFVLVGIGIHSIASVVNTYLWISAKRIASDNLSPIMEAQWRVNRANALGNIFVILSLALGLLFYTYEWSHIIDPASAIFLVLFTGKSFIELIKTSLSDLLDHTLDEKQQLMILKRLAEYEDSYERFYDIRSRKSGSKIFIEISLGFDPVRKAGEILDATGRIKERLEVDIPNSEVTILINSLETFQETIALKALPGSISPLTEEHLDECVEIARNAFPKDDIEEIKLQFLASIYPNRYLKELRERGLEKPRYWVGIKDEKALGFVGMCYKLDEPDAVWGGWMAARSTSANTDLRIKMYFMWKVAFEARQTGRKYFRLYTSTLPTEAAANKLYDNIGLKVYKREQDKDCEILYREAEVFKIYERIRPGKKRHYKTVAG
jgi:cation diffusion facilitator family transporter